MVEECDTAARRERCFLAGAAALLILVGLTTCFIEMKSHAIRSQPMTRIVLGHVLEVRFLGKVLCRWELDDTSQVESRRQLFERTRWAFLIVACFALLGIVCEQHVRSLR